MTALRAILAAARTEDLQSMSDIVRRRFPGGEVTPVAATTSSDDLLKAVGGGRFDLILCDIDMAGLLGAWLRSHAPSTGQAAVVVARSLNDPRVDRLKALGAHVVTPGGLADLLAKWAAAPGGGDDGLFAGVTGQRMITFHSPKGGTGTSTLAAHLALRMAAEGARVALVDLALYGASHVLFKVQQRGFGFGELISAMEHEDLKAESREVRALLAKCMARVDTPGQPISLLAAAPALRMGKLGGKQTEAILGHLAEMEFDRILVDTSSELAERNLAAIAEAGQVILVTAPDVSCGWNLMQFREVLSLLQVKGTVSMVVNRVGANVGFDIREFESLCGYRTAVSLPDAGTTLQHLANTTTPHHLKENHPYAVAVRQLAAMLNGGGG